VNIFQNPRTTSNINFGQLLMASQWMRACLILATVDENEKYSPGAGFCNYPGTKGGSAAPTMPIYVLEKQPDKNSWQNKISGIYIIRRFLFCHDFYPVCFSQHINRHGRSSTAAFWFRVIAKAAPGEYFSFSSTRC